jgi:hypothetical protein
MDSPTSQPESPRAALPQVEPPSASFLLQLFLIPLVIVLAIVMVWLLFSWLAHLGASPEDLVRDIGKMNDASWQKAYNLAEMLRKPQYDHLKDNPDLALELAATLDKLRTTRPDRQDEIAAAKTEKRRVELSEAFDKRLKLEEFLCKALGEMRATDGLPALVRAAQPVDDPAAFSIRAAAIQSIAVAASHVEPKTLQANEPLMEAVIEASRASSEGPDARAYRNLASNAAFTLGMIGGSEALDRLNFLLDDGDANTRYNAATGLARHGDARALPVILEMLDPKNTEGLDDPDAKTEEQVALGQEWKRALVMTNGLRAAKQLVQKKPDADYSELKKSLAKLKTADVIERVKLDARELELVLAK